MKKLYITLFITLCTLSVQAWIFPDNYATQKISVNTSRLTFCHVTSSSSVMSTGYILYDKNSQLLVNLGRYTQVKTSDGIFVGQRKRTESDTEDFYDAIFSMGQIQGTSPLKSVTLTYYKLNPDNDLECVENGCVKTKETSEIIDGTEYFTVSYIYNVPATQFIVSHSDKGTRNTTCALAKAFGYSVRGVIVTNIEVEYVTNISTPITDMASALSSANNAATRNKVNNIIAASELSAYKSRAQAQNGDVNLDGAVNVTDVVTIYNNIINGTEMPTKSGQPYVDLGLPSGLKWATCNLGATTPEGYGDYFSWAPSDSSFAGGKTTFNSTEYKSSIPSTTYSEDGTGFSDAAFPPYSILRYRNKWQSWRLPTIAEYQELLDNCIAEDKTINGVTGKLFTSKINNKTIFFPYCGHFTSSGFFNGDGSYWTKSSTRAGHACSFWCFEGVSKIQEESYRHLGASIRCVTY